MIQGRAALLFGSVCSGIEAASVAWHGLGWRAAWLAEIDKFASAVLAHHYPSVPNLGDMTKIARAILLGDVPAPDVLCGGTPCQAFSVAGLRESLADARGNLTLKFVEIANAIDHVRTGRGEDECIVFWENVPGVLSTKDNAFGCFLAGLAGEYEPLVPPGKTPKPGQPWKWANAGAVYGPRRAIAWRTLDAQYFGVAQRRRRVFVVASARTGFDPAQVLFEWDSVRRDTAPSRQARQTAPTIPSRSTAGGGLGTDFDCDGGLIQAYGGNNTAGAIDVATARNACASASGRMDFESETFLVQPARTLLGKPDCSHAADKETYLTHSLRDVGFDASEDGPGRGTPLVPVCHVETMPTMTAGGPADTSHNQVSGQMRDQYLVPMAYAPEVAGTLVARSSRGGGQTNSPGHQADQMLVAGAHAPAIAFPANLSGTQCASSEDLAPSMGALNPTAVAVGTDTYNGAITGEIAATLGTQSGDGLSSGPSVMQALQVRRLTPEECEALQGFPRGYTAIPWRGKPAELCPDGPRYKALGNSWAVPNVAWIGRRIHAALHKT